MKQYLDLLEHIMKTGTDKPNRTGIDTRSVFGAQMQRGKDLRTGVRLPSSPPLKSTKTRIKNY